MTMQFNKISGEVYQGQNQGQLQGVKEKNNYKSDEWLTFLQARGLGLKIKKGSKGVAIFKGYGTFERKNAEGKIKTETAPLGWATVFNLDQTEKAK